MQWDVQVVGLDAFRVPCCRDLRRLINDHPEEEFECFRCAKTIMLTTQFEQSWNDGYKHAHITTGVACATFPTSSSFCMIFFIRACNTFCGDDKLCESCGSNMELTTGNFVDLFLFFMACSDGAIVRTAIRWLANVQGRCSGAEE